MPGNPKWHIIADMQKAQEIDLDLIEVSIKCTVGQQLLKDILKYGFWVSYIPLVDILDTENANVYRIEKVPQ